MQSEKELTFGSLKITPSSPKFQVICHDWCWTQKCSPENELLFVTDGEFILNINGYVYVVTANHLAFIPKGSSYSYQLTSKRRLSYYSTLMDAELYDQHICEYLSLVEDNHVVKVDDSEKIRSYFDACATKFNDFYSYRINLCAQLAMIFAAYIEKRLLMKSEQDNLKTNAWASLIRYMEGNLNQKLSLGDFAKFMHMSASTFSRKFLNEFGMSPIRYFGNLRAQKAADLILHSTQSLSRIAQAIGIENIYYFNRFFEKNMHISPQEYMQISRRDDEV